MEMKATIYSDKMMRVHFSQNENNIDENVDREEKLDRYLPLLAVSSG